MLVLLGQIDAFAYDRMVLFEDFTSSTCPPCYTSAAAVEGALEATEDIVAPIAFHMSWPNVNPRDPWYLDNPGDNDGRRNYYGVNSIPRFFIDGTQYGSSPTRAAFISAIENRADRDSQLEMVISGSIVDDELQVFLTITAEEELNDVTLYVALNEDYVWYDGVTAQRDYYDAMVKMIPNYRGTGFDIEAEDTLEYEFTQDMEGLGWHELEVDNLILVAWVQDDDEVHQAATYYLSINSPLIELAEWAVSDGGDGDGDGRAEAGETADLMITLENAPNYLPAETVEVTLTTEDEGIDIIDGAFQLDELPNGESADNSEAPFRFQVAEEFEPHPVTFNMSIIAQPGDFEGAAEITFMVDWPPILVVDAADDDSAAVAMRRLFGNDLLPYADYWDRTVEGVVTGDYLVNHRAVLWFTMITDEDVISEYEQGELMDYLDGGGAFIVSSSFLAADIGESRFCREYLAASLETDNARFSLVRGYENEMQFGDSRVYLGGGPVGWPGATAIIAPLEGARAAMFYEDNHREFAGIAAVIHETDTYKTLFFGFPIETIAGAVQTEPLDQFAGRIWDWVNNELEAPPDEASIPQRFALDPAFPNPFNARVVVPFSLERSGWVTLALHDLSGREVTRLVNAALPAGQHRTTLDAASTGLTSGLYYLRLTTGGRSINGKLLYLR